MPEEKTIYWEEMLLGSFVHLVLERGVQWRFQTVEEFINLAKELNLEPNWESVDINEALPLIKIFFERNKNKFSPMSKTEQKLLTKLGNINFVGFADRIDFHEDGLEIIDYKTGRSQVPPKHRNWQLSYYALAAQQFGKVKKITLDMLRQEKPLEFELKENGTAVATNSSRMEFNIYEVEQELILTAKAIINAYEKGFRPCPIEKNCEFCNEYFYS